MFSWPLHLRMPGQADLTSEGKGQFPESLRKADMKMLVFLIIFALVISVLIWRMRKSQAAEELAQRKALDGRKKRQKEAITPEIDMVWPVIIRPVSGKRTPGEAAVEEPSMAEIEFTPSDQLTAQQGRSSKAAG
jgi:hypothetical protein